MQIQLIKSKFRLLFCFPSADSVNCGWKTVFLQSQPQIPNSRCKILFYKGLVEYMDAKGWLTVDSKVILCGFTTVGMSAPLTPHSTPFVQESAIVQLFSFSQWPLSMKRVATITLIRAMCLLQWTCWQYCTFCTLTLDWSGQWAVICFLLSYRRSSFLHRAGPTFSLPVPNW